ncbi:MAG: hypothetical protein M3Z37_08915 [Candidatus Eremiobacteraeota bacterium]|nr:hypothetical protein [Candidatus Eremiobacteraeota bacterium]
MRKELLIAAASLLLALSSVANADEGPTYKGPLSPAERAFVRSIQSDLNARFPHAADAERQGYVRYTGVDETGAISYANMHWTSEDTRHPSQLWYDVNGTLLGADFSRPMTGPARPHAFGVNPGRWYGFDDHIHYVRLNPKTGAGQYDLYIMPADFRKSGGDPKHPTAADLVKLHKAKSTAQVVRVFDFPAVWDLIVWVKPNPKGAFAVKNPLVKT